MTIRRSTLFALVMGGLTAVTGLIVLANAAFVIRENEQAIILQFGAPVGEAITEPGLHFKRPFVQNVRRFDKRLYTLEGFPNEIPTKGREFIFVDTTARWRISDPQRFLESVRDETGARSRLNDIIDSAVRDEISSLELVEIIRSTDWNVDDQALGEDPADTQLQDLDELRVPITVGREGLTRRIVERARRETDTIGIEVTDIQIRRINYIKDVQRTVYERMISERRRIAAQFRSEGEGRSAEIQGRMQRDLRQVQSDAFRIAEAVRGRGDAEAARIYGEAFAMAPEFFAFQRTLESYARTIGEQTTLVLDVDSEYFRLLSDIGETTDDLSGLDIEAVIRRLEERPTVPLLTEDDLEEIQDILPPSDTEEK
jgi:membrane protease subunit HflC